ncbi:MAG: hypothetical protein JSV04_12660, partial [Candidatus Heimdallarchaeota archaeon]
PFLGVGTTAPIVSELFWRVGPSNGSRLTSSLLDLYALGLSDLGVQNVTIVRIEAPWSVAMSGSLKYYLNTYLPTTVGTPVISFTNDITISDAATYSTVWSELFPLKSELDGLHVNAILTLVNDPAGRHVTEAWTELNLPQILAGINVEAQSYNHFEETEGAAYGEIYLIAVPPDIELTPKTGPFRQAYFNEFDRPPAPFASLSYDAVYVLKDAIERAGSFDPAAIQVALEDTDYVGASYKIRFTSEPNVWTHPLFGYPYGHVGYYENGTRYVIPGVPTNLTVHDLWTTSTVGAIGTPYNQGFWVQWQKYGTQKTIWGYDPVSTRKITDHIEWPINHSDSGYVPKTTEPTTTTTTTITTTTTTTTTTTPTPTLESTTTPTTLTTTTKTTTTTTSETSTSEPPPAVSPGFELLATLAVLAGLLIYKRLKRK